MIGTAAAAQASTGTIESRLVLYAMNLMTAKTRFKAHANASSANKNPDHKNFRIGPSVVYKKTLPMSNGRMTSRRMKPAPRPANHEKFELEPRRKRRAKACFFCNKSVRTNADVIRGFGVGFAVVAWVRVRIVGKPPQRVPSCLEDGVWPERVGCADDRAH
jgi:hypothetical protein